MVLYPFLVLSAQHREDFVLAEDHVLDAVELHFGPGVLAEEDAITLLHGDGPQLAALQDLPVAGGHDRSLHGLLLGGIRNDDATFGLLLLLKALDNDAVGERTNLHGTGDLPPALERPRPLATLEVSLALARCERQPRGS